MNQWLKKRASKPIYPLDWEVLGRGKCMATWTTQSCSCIFWGRLLLQPLSEFMEAVHYTRRRVARSKAKEVIDRQNRRWPYWGNDTINHSDTLPISDARGSTRMSSKRRHGRMAAWFLMPRAMVAQHQERLRWTQESKILCHLLELFLVVQARWCMPAS